MAKVLGDICFPTGKYVKDGEEKTNWGKCGILLQTDNGMRIKLDMIPLGIPEGGAWFSVFEKRDDPKPASQSRSDHRTAASRDPSEPDLPF